MNIQGIPAAEQWAEIRRVAQEKTVQRQQVTARQMQSTYAETTSSRSLQTMNEELKRLRTVFTRTGGIEQNYIPKGVLFDKRG
ncbi:MAG: hypothetical protein ACKOBV_05355 [Candidatus Kapaibacterium sp.]